MSTSDHLQVLLVLAVMIAVLALGALLLRRLGLPARLAPETGRRIAVSETRWLDSRTRLVLVRWDDREHLLLLTPQQATVVPGARVAVLPAGDPPPLRERTP